MQKFVVAEGRFENEPVFFVLKRVGTNGWECNSAWKERDEALIRTAELLLKSHLERMEGVISSVNAGHDDSVGEYVVDNIAGVARDITLVVGDLRRLRDDYHERTRA